MAVPPPPPLLPVPREQDGKVVCASTVENHHQYFREPLQLKEEVGSLVEYLLKNISKSTVTHSSSGVESVNSHGEPAVITHVREVTPVVQSGPMCGLTALSMAYELISEEACEQENSTRHPECLLAFARAHNLSRQGEIFSVQYMQEIAEQHLHLNSKITRINSLQPITLLQTLLSNDRAVIVPYDADKDHSPCQAKGHKAHWCLLVGFAIVTPPAVNKERDYSSALKWCRQSTRCSQYYSVNKDERDSFLTACTSILGETTDTSVFQNDQLYVFARHGKSTHMGLWSYRNLVGSCQNLSEVDPKRTQPAGDYVIPEGGVQEGLNSKIIIASSKSTLTHTP